MTRFRKFVAGAALAAAAGVTLAPTAAALVDAQDATDNDVSGSVGFLITYESEDGVMKEGLKNGSRCTGTLIDKQWVITAKHCMQASNPDNQHAYVSFGIDGSHETFSSSSEKVYSHPDTDVSLIKLKVPAPDSIKPVPLWEGSLGDLKNVSGGTDSESYGWSTYAMDGNDKLTKRADNLTYAQGKLDGARIKTTEVNGAFSNNIFTYASTFGDGVKIVEGDSGGPLIVDGKLFGTLTGTLVDKSGEQKNVGLYVPAAEHGDWINETIGSDVVNPIDAEEDKESDTNQKVEMPGPDADGADSSTSSNQNESSSGSSSQPTATINRDTTSPSATNVSDSGSSGESRSSESSTPTMRRVDGGTSSSSSVNDEAVGPSVNTGGGVESQSFFTKVKAMFS